MNDNTNSYLSDEDLKKLIEDVEAHDMMHAPPYLEDQTMQRLRKRLQAQKQVSKNRQLFYFSSKIIAATAASLALLITTPDFTHNPSSYVRKEPSVSITRKINSATDKFCDSLKEHTYKIITFGGNQYDK